MCWLKEQIWPKTRNPLDFSRTYNRINYVPSFNIYGYFYTHNNCDLFIIKNKLFGDQYLVEFRVKDYLVKVKVKVNMKANDDKKHGPEHKKIMIHKNSSTPKQIILKSPGIDDDSNLYIHSRLSIITTPEKQHISSSTAAIVSSKTYKEALLRKIPRKHEYEGS